MTDSAFGQLLDRFDGLDRRLERIETRLERVEGLTARVAVLERQDETTKDLQSRCGARLDSLEAGRLALVKLDGLEVGYGKIKERVQKLERTDAERAGLSRAGLMVWAALTAAPGLVGLVLAVWSHLGT